MKKRNLLGLRLDQLTELAVSLGQPSFRAKQLYHQIYRKRQERIDSMTDLPADFRGRLSEHWEIRLPEISREFRSADGTTRILFRLEDGSPVETVHIPEERRDTLCISSQVGCGLGCTFCLTAKMGLLRNLKPAEIIGQVMAASSGGYVEDQGYNIVFMGMGEPLYNFANVMEAFRLLTDPAGIGLSYRRITVSTAGVVPVLRKMHGEKVLPNLAVSLNATTDEVRDRIMPINRKWKLEELLSACREFPLEPRRRITFEYVLLKGVNDSDADALRLTKCLHGLKAKVNLIPYNPNPGLEFRRPDAGRVERFREILTDRHISAFVRRPRGDDISAACGQLAYLEQVDRSA